MLTTLVTSKPTSDVEHLTDVVSELQFLDVAATLPSRISVDGSVDDMDALPKWSLQSITLVTTSLTTNAEAKQQILKCSSPMPTIMGSTPCQSSQLCLSLGGILVALLRLPPSACLSGPVALTSSSGGIYVAISKLLLSAICPITQLSFATPILCFVDRTLIATFDCLSLGTSVGFHPCSVGGILLAASDCLSLGAYVGLHLLLYRWNHPCRFRLPPSMVLLHTDFSRGSTFTTINQPTPPPFEPGQPNNKPTKGSTSQLSNTINQMSNPQGINHRLHLAILSLPGNQPSNILKQSEPAKIDQDMKIRSSGSAARTHLEANLNVRRYAGALLSMKNIYNKDVPITP
eukprot:Gb_27506 [translate_table: standard]